MGRVVRAKSRASVASRVIRVQSPTASAWAGTSQEPPTQTQLGRAKNSNAFFSVTPPVGGNSMSNNRPIGALSLAGKNLRSVKSSSRACRISPRVASLGSSARPAPRTPPRSAQSPESPARLASPARPSRPLYSWGCPRVLIKASHRHTALPSRRCAARQQQVREPCPDRCPPVLVGRSSRSVFWSALSKLNSSGSNSLSVSDPIFGIRRSPVRPESSGCRYRFAANRANRLAAARCRASAREGVDPGHARPGQAAARSET